MKKAMIAANILFFVIVGFYACNNQKSDSDACQKIHSQDFTGQPIKGYLDVNLAKEIADAYYADKDKSFISDAGGVTNVEDSRTVWFDLQTLKQYIWQIEDTLCKQGCNIDSLGLGLHLYFAKYPDSSLISQFGVEPRYANHQTIFLTATYKGKKNNIDFDPFHPGPDKCKPTPLRAYLQRSSNSREGMKLSGGDGAGVLNHGGLIPPPPGEGSFPSDDN